VHITATGMMCIGHLFAWITSRRPIVPLLVPREELPRHHLSLIDYRTRVYYFLQVTYAIIFTSSQKNKKHALKKYVLQDVITTT